MKINTLHIELTDKCQAACPMCLRNTYGAGERPHIKNTEITLDQFTKWFPIDFLKDLRYFYACGNNGDPLLAKDCLEIFEYVANNSECGLSIHTNGSLRSKNWWTRAGQVLGNRGSIVFAIDGFKGEHELYRRNTNWDKIIENAKTFIAAGGRAKADCIVFKHNEDRIEELEKFLYSIGFEHVNLKPTERFYGKAEIPVYNEQFETAYIIQPPTNSKWKKGVIKPNFVKLVDKQVLQSIIDTVVIDNPECFRGENIYVNSTGKVFPCCIIGGCNELQEDIGIEDNNEKIIRNVNIQSGIDLMTDLGMNDLDNKNIAELMVEGKWLEKLPKHWNEEKKFVCARMCGKDFNKLVE